MKSTSKTFTESRISSGTSRRELLYSRAVGTFLYCGYASSGSILLSTVATYGCFPAFENIADRTLGTMDVVHGR